jgi:hypothetical protein
MAKIEIFCDESCHIQHDGSKAMALGAIYCLSQYKDDIKKSLRKIKADYGFGIQEIKWSRLSKKYLPMYKKIIDYFFETNSLSYRAVLITDKESLSFPEGSTFDEWYYKMYYLLLFYIISKTEATYAIFLDRKDTNGRKKVEKLEDVLDSAAHDFMRIERIVEVDSQCNDFVQLADFFTGAMTFYCRGFSSGQKHDDAKKAIVEYIAKKTNITRTALIQESKFNLLYWNGKRYVR